MSSIWNGVIGQMTAAYYSSLTQEKAVFLRLLIPFLTKKLCTSRIQL